MVTITTASTDKFKLAKRERITAPVISVVETTENHATKKSMITANFNGKDYNVTREIGEMSYAGAWPTDSEITTFLNTWITANKITA